MFGGERCHHGHAQHCDKQFDFHDFSFFSKVSTAQRHLLISQVTISWSSSLLPVRVAFSFDIQGESPTISFGQAPKCRHCGPSNPVLNDIGVFPGRPLRRLIYELRGPWRERLGEWRHPATGNSVTETALLLVEFAAALQILVGLSKRRDSLGAIRADFRVEYYGGKPPLRRRWLRVA